MSSFGGFAGAFARARRVLLGATGRSWLADGGRPGRRRSSSGGCSGGSAARSCTTTSGGRASSCSRSASRTGRGTTSASTSSCTRWWCCVPAVLVLNRRRRAGGDERRRAGAAVCAGSVPRGLPAQHRSCRGGRPLSRAHGGAVRVRWRCSGSPPSWRCASHVRGAGDLDTPASSVWYRRSKGGVHVHLFPRHRHAARALRRTRRGRRRLRAGLPERRCSSRAGRDGYHDVVHPAEQHAEPRRAAREARGARRRRGGARHGERHGRDHDDRC